MAQREVAVTKKKTRAPPFNQRRLVQTAEPAKQLLRRRSSASSDAGMALQAFANDVLFWVFLFFFNPVVFTTTK